ASDVPASDKEAAAWSNVGPVSADTGATDAGADEMPAEEVTHVPDETEPVEKDARAEEAEEASTEPEAGHTEPDAAPGEIVAVQEAESTADLVSPEAAPLTEANPSGEALSEAATASAHDSDTHGQSTDGDAVEEWVEEGGMQKAKDDETLP
ncbi:MAG: hypothetical protein H7290_20230, partial [Flavobacterium sp.]|nr:hypothetical protein [Aeromicrobium sp.]